MLFLTRMISDICCIVYFSYILQTGPYGLDNVKYMNYTRRCIRKSLYVE